MESPSGERVSDPARLDMRDATTSSIESKEAAVGGGVRENLLDQCEAFAKNYRVLSVAMLKERPSVVHASSLPPQELHPFLR